jgi:Flp pilus assembly protein CpaB
MRYGRNHGDGRGAEGHLSDWAARCSRNRGRCAMRYLVGFRGVTLLATLLTLAASTAGAQAESDDVVVLPGQLEVVPHDELQSRLAELESAYQNANVRKPRAGVAVSAVAITAGAGLLVGGLVVESWDNESTPASTAAIASGIAALMVGAGGLVFSAIRLKRAKRERRRLEPELQSLRSALGSGAEQR